MRSLRIAIAATAALALAPASASALSLNFAKIEAFSTKGDQGLLIVEASKSRTRITGSFSWGEEFPKTFMLSGRSCSGVKSHQNRPGFIGKPIYSANPANGVTFQGEASRPLKRRQLNATKSIVVVSNNKFTGCGRSYYYDLKNVQVTN